MVNQDFDNLGDKVQDIIDKAVNAKNYQQLSQSVNQAVNRAIDNGSDALRDALNSAFYGSGYSRKDRDGQENPEHHARAYEMHRTHAYQQPSFGRRQGVERRGNMGEKGTNVVSRTENTSLSLYSRNNLEQVKNILLTTFGGILTGGMGIGLLITGIVAVFAGGSSWIGMGAPIALGVGTAVSAVMLGKGCAGLGRLGRFRRYVKALGNHTYCNFEQLSRAVGKPVHYVKKDIKAMITKGWFLEGHVDQQETCLITSNETYKQYEETVKQLEERQRAEDPKIRVESGVSSEVQEVLDKGNEYLVKIRESNDAIPGEEISAKISHMELIVQKIFQRAKEHPEVIPDLKHLMDYYLPMTVKLLDAYEDMDSQPVQGENIRNSKQEIEKTIDTLNTAFEKLLDSIFKDVAWDVSSDISVLNTVLAQEGLTEDDFQRMKREAQARTREHAETV